MSQTRDHFDNTFPHVMAAIHAETQKDNDSNTDRRVQLILTVSSLQMEWSCVPNITAVKVRKRMASRQRKISSSTDTPGENSLHSGCQKTKWQVKFLLHFICRVQQHLQLPLDLKHKFSTFRPGCKSPTMWCPILSSGAFYLSIIDRWQLRKNTKVVL